jgi:hypothetical protein
MLSPRLLEKVACAPNGAAFFGHQLRCRPLRGPGEKAWFLPAAQHDERHPEMLRSPRGYWSFSEF